MKTRKVWMTVEDSRWSEGKGSLEYDKFIVNNYTYIWDMNLLSRVKVTDIPDRQAN